jgi:hypothetical protein
MTGIAKAWVNFDSSSGSSCVIGTSFNVSSVTYNATGDYTVNFITAMPDANYSAIVNSHLIGNTIDTASVNGSTPYATTSVRIKTGGASILGDPAYVNVAIFR